MISAHLLSNIWITSSPKWTRQCSYIFWRKTNTWFVTKLVTYITIWRTAPATYTGRVIQFFEVFQNLLPIFCLWVYSCTTKSSTLIVQLLPTGKFIWNFQEIAQNSEKFSQLVNAAFLVVKYIFFFCFMVSIGLL